ncbi:hypothetical protein BGW42_000707 [Actinomortierella wolfii]|nr:hypothetical protein BGW42_000707 [Actinomortierella wolfii]
MRLSIYLTTLAMAVLAVKADVSPIQQLQQQGVLQANAANAAAPADAAAAAIPQADPAVAATADEYSIGFEAEGDEPIAEFVDINGNPLQLENPATFPNLQDYETFKKALENSPPQAAMAIDNVDEDAAAADDEDEDFYGTGLPSINDDEDEDEWEDEDADWDDVDEDGDEYDEDEVDEDVDETDGVMEAEWKRKHKKHKRKKCVIKKTVVLTPPCPTATPIVVSAALF